MEPEKELDVLEYIYRNKEAVRQRDLAEIAGVSLGMINVILKRLAVRGWIKIKKINNRNIHYIVSPAGMEAISHRSYSFFKRTVRSLVYYKDILEHELLEIKHKGYTTVVLVGRSEVDFLVEHFCMKYGLGYFRSWREEKRKVQLSVGIDNNENREKGLGTEEPETLSRIEQVPRSSDHALFYYLISEEILQEQHREGYPEKSRTFLRELLIK